jgi:hypothetical protein
MGANWQSDWLYDLIFLEAERLWKWCTPDKDHWQYVLIEELPNEMTGHPIGDPVRSWIRDKNGLREIPLNEHKNLVKKIQERIFPFILMSFYIFPDRQHVIVGHQEANTSGSGSQYAVQGSGRDAKLIPDEHGSAWVS